MRYGSLPQYPEIDAWKPEITRRIDDAKQKMGRVMQIASFSLADRKSVV